jgi:phosphate transport system substrate-binding protein
MVPRRASHSLCYRDYIDDESPAGLPFAFPGYRGEPEAELAEFTLEAVAEKGKSQRLAQIINHLIATNASTHEAYLNLIKGTSEMGLLARPPSKDELKAAEDAGVSFEITPCAKDAFVFLVHRGNPIRDLSIDQIKQIYAGEITQWQQLGKFTGRITAYQREEESGSQQLMRSLVMKDAPLKSSTRGPNNRNLIGSLMSSVYLELSDDEEGIAYSIFYYEQYMSGSPRTRLLAVDGVEPSAASISDGSYPLLSPVYVVTRKGIDPNSPTAKLRAWLLSAEGQRVVAESGYVPLAREF